MLSENILSLRKKKGISQEDLAAELHVVRQTVSKWEKGLSVPDAQMLIRIASALDTTVNTLLGESIPESEPQPSVQDIASRLEEVNMRLPIRRNAAESVCVSFS
ncbi:MAG: helix-turn-helix transcriptional regulator [Clostridiales bacterium]|nr:helix-turn-helix transcriptional regulator [Clostridiales bacterium]